MNYNAPSERDPHYLGDPNMSNILPQDWILRAIFPPNWNKQKARKRPRPEMNYDSLFGTTQK